MEEFKKALAKIVPFFVAFVMVVSAWLLFKDYSKAVDLLLGAIGIFK